MKSIRRGLAASIAVALTPGISMGAAADDRPTAVSATLEEVVVTARLRRESLQQVPDSITAFTAADIESAGINDVQDFVDMVPNVTMRKTWRSGNTFITIRGITSGAQGWPPVSFVVDGVRASSLDAINEGALVDIDRIEVLKGPQGALYGSGAIGGAINVVTRPPTDEFEGAVSAAYATGSDVTVNALLSGPVVEERLRVRVNAYYRNSDGLIDSNNGDDLDFVDQKTVRARLDYAASDALRFDLRVSHTTSDNGALFQDKVARADLIDAFDGPGAPGPRRRPGMVGTEDRQITDASFRMQWDAAWATTTLTVGYQDLDSLVYGSVAFDEPPLPAAQTTLRAPVSGNAATAGQNIDEFQYVGDDYDTRNADLRFTSRVDGPLRWVVGTEYMAREGFNWFELGHLVAPLPGTQVTRSGRYDVKEDRLWSVYGQVSYDILPALELTAAGRYDRNRYNSTRVGDRAAGTVIPLPDPGGVLVPTLVAEDSKFQPKVQLSYDWSDAMMLYATYSEGFRSGFFNTGNLTLPESTTNYEIGVKSEWWNRRVRLNAAVFHTDYANQQVSQTIATPPFRVTVNLPETDIDGAELEMGLRPTDRLSLSVGAGYTKSVLITGIRSPFTPKWTGNVAAEYTWPLGARLSLSARADYRYQGWQYMRPNQLFPMEAKNYLDARLTLRADAWALKAYVDNATDERQATSFGPFAGSFVRSYSLPRSYGIEASYRFGGTR